MKQINILSRVLLVGFAVVIVAAGCMNSDDSAVVEPELTSTSDPIVEARPHDYGKACLDCHQGHGYPMTMVDKLYSLAEAIDHTPFFCTTCHEPHGETSNIRIIREQIETPHSGAKNVIFLAETGPNSYADGDAVYDGICEVCHTTTRFHRNNPSGSHSHKNGDNCTQCHNHWNDWLRK